MERELVTLNGEAAGAPPLAPPVLTLEDADSDGDVAALLECWGEGVENWELGWGTGLDPCKARGVGEGR